MTDPIELATDLENDSRDDCGNIDQLKQKAAQALRAMQRKLDFYEDGYTPYELLQAENERMRERLTVIEGMLDQMPDAYQPPYEVAREYQAWAEALDTELCNLKADEEERRESA